MSSCSERELIIDLESSESESDSRISNGRKSLRPKEVTKSDENPDSDDDCDASPNKRKRVIEPNFEIIIGDRKFLSRKEQLFKYPYFKREIPSGKSALNLDPKLFSGNHFRKVFDYIHGSRITLNDENFDEIYKTAYEFRLNELKAMVEKYMKENMSTDNVGAILRISEEYDPPELKAKCEEYIEQHLFSIPRNEIQNVFVEYPYLKLKKIIEERGKSFEEQALHLCIEWTMKKKDEENDRLEHLPELLKAIPLSKLPSKFLQETVSRTPKILESKECLQLVVETFANYGPLLTSGSETLYAIGGVDKECLSSMSKFDPGTKEWSKSSAMPFARSHFGCAVVGHKIYVCGGWTGRKYIDKLHVFDTHTGEWSELKPMKCAKGDFSMTALGGYLYIAGGFDDEGKKDQTFKTVERYCIETDQWDEVSPMGSERSAHVLLELNGFLYAIGGGTGKKWNKTVERYDPSNDTWEEQEHMKLAKKFRWGGAAVLNGRIYIADGQYCRVYHPETRQWSNMTEPAKCGHGLRLVALNGKLFAIGGNKKVLESLRENIHEEDYQGITTVERFDMETAAWIEESNMDIARCVHSLAVVKKL